MPYAHALWQGRHLMMRKTAPSVRTLFNGRYMPVAVHSQGLWLSHLNCHPSVPKNNRPATQYKVSLAQHSMQFMRYVSSLCLNVDRLRHFDGFCQDSATTAVAGFRRVCGHDCMTCVTNSELERCTSEVLVSSGPHFVLEPAFVPSGPGLAAC